MRTILNLVDLDPHPRHHGQINLPTPPGSQFQPGLVGMPAVLAAHKEIGKEIISSRQGDIDFSLKSMTNLGRH
jgi:hypothetical protein